MSVKAEVKSSNSAEVMARMGIDGGKLKCENELVKYSWEFWKRESAFLAPHGILGSLGKRVNLFKYCHCLGSLSVFRTMWQYGIKANYSLSEAMKVFLSCHLWSHKILQTPEFINLKHGCVPFHSWNCRRQFTAKPPPFWKGTNTTDEGNGGSAETSRKNCIYFDKFEHSEIILQNLERKHYSVCTSTLQHDHCCPNCHHLQLGNQVVSQVSQIYA